MFVQSSTSQTTYQAGFSESRLEMTPTAELTPPNRPSGDSLSADVPK